MQSIFKKITLSFLALILVFTLAACGKQETKKATQPKTPIEQMTQPGHFVYEATKDDLDTDANPSDAISTIIKFGKNHTYQEQMVSGGSSKISLQTPAFQTGDEAQDINSGTWSIHDGNKLVLKSKQGEGGSRKLAKKISGKLPADDTAYVGFNDPSFKTSGALIWKK